MSKKCWCENYCKHATSCNPVTCSIYVIFEALYKQSNIPKRYQYPCVLNATCPQDNAVFQTVFSIKSDIVNWVSEGHSLVLQSTIKGNGKTTLAGMLAHAYIKEMLDTTSLQACVYYISVPSFLEEIRASMKQNDDTLASRIKLIKTVPLLIMDDLGAEKPSDWVRERLYEIINERYNNELTTIYTTNNTPEELLISLQDRIVSRVMYDTTLRLYGQSQRRM